jgi:hypothetical protein
MQSVVREKVGSVSGCEKRVWKCREDAESSETEKLTNVMKTSFNLFDSACASSDGGPGLNLGEHMAGRSRFGTGKNEIFFAVSPMRRAEGKGHT